MEFHITRKFGKILLPEQRRKIFRLLPGIHSSDIFARLQEETIAELHDVSFVNTRDFFAIIFDGIVESKFGDSLGFDTRHNF